MGKLFWNWADAKYLVIASVNDKLRRFGLSCFEIIILPFCVVYRMAMAVFVFAMCSYQYKSERHFRSGIMVCKIDIIFHSIHRYRLGAATIIHNNISKTCNTVLISFTKRSINGKIRTWIDCIPVSYWKVLINAEWVCVCERVQMCINIWMCVCGWAKIYWWTLSLGRFRHFPEYT